MKKSLYLLLLLVMALAVAFSMTACDKDKDNGDNGNNASGECDHVFNTDGDYAHDAEAHWYACTKGCGAKYKIGEHIFGDPVVTVDSTCVSLGVATRTCTVCDATTEQEIKLKKHTPGTEYASDGANHWQICSSCQGKINVEAHDYVTRGFDKDNHWYDCKCGAHGTAEAHAWDEGVPNPNNDGTKLVKCTAAGCNASKTVSDTNHEHTYTGVETEAASCTKTGTMTYSCNCGDSYTESISLKPHSFTGAWTYDELQHWHACANCGATPPASEKAAHDFSGKPTTDGYNKVYTCECGKTKSESTGGYIDPEGWT